MLSDRRLFDREGLLGGVCGGRAVLPEYSSNIVPSDRRLFDSEGWLGDVCGGSVVLSDSEGWLGGVYWVSAELCEYTLEIIELSDRRLGGTVSGVCLELPRRLRGRWWWSNVLLVLGRR